MEKRKVITCVYSAIEDGTIKGDMSDNHKEFVFDTIKTTNQAGDESTWTIKVVAYDKDKEKNIKFKLNMLKSPVVQLPKNIIGRYYVENITHTGHTRDSDITDVLVGKNIGKKNATTSVGQAILMANSLYQNKLNKSDSGTKKASSIERPLPMLVKKEGSTGKAAITTAELEDGIIVEPKLDGIRMVAHINKDGDVELYSRTAKVFYGLTQIEKDVADMLYKQNLYRPEEIYLDGEIYLHGKQLQYISGAVRGEGEKSGDVVKSELKYYIFDCFLPKHLDMLQKDRKEILDKLFSNGNYPNLVLVEGRVVNNRKDLDKVYEDYLKDGYEGAIARRKNRVYEFGKNNYHSDALLKIKPVETDEFEIVGYKDGSGKDKGAVIFELKTASGKKFVAPPKGQTYQERKDLFAKFKTDTDEFKNNYLGKMATVQYANLSKQNTPLQPKFITIREYE